MSVTVYTVKGMTCEHCVKSVTSELGAVPGVCDVQVDLPTGQVTVTGDGRSTTKRCAPPSARPVTKW